MPHRNAPKAARLLALPALMLFLAVGECRASELLVGTASASITPDQPVALAGQMHTRISQGVRAPVTATALALETRDGDKSVDQAIFVACDLVCVEKPTFARVRELLKERAPDFDPGKLVLSATHTHTAPVLDIGKYRLPAEGIIQPQDYLEFLAQRITDAATVAWTGRRPGKVGWGLGHAVLGQNRRAMYADGRSVMYGRTDLPDFRGIEGPEDHTVEVLFFWTADGDLVATAVNVVCPSQEVEGDSVVDADFWHQIRQALKARHGEELAVLGWTGAAGDQSPHLMFRKDAEDRMRELRGLSRVQELARRVVIAWEEAYDGACKDEHADVPLVHTVETIDLPERIVNDDEVALTRKEIEKYAADPNNQRWSVWHQEVVDRYERQKQGKVEPYHMELHVVRLGDVAIATNEFELFTQYGIQIKARSQTLQTFVIQLAGPGSYLPTDIAVPRGGYSAIVESSVVGPEGGRVLVDQTVDHINKLFREPQP